MVDQVLCASRGGYQQIDRRRERADVVVNVHPAHNVEHTQSERGRWLIQAFAYLCRQLTRRRQHQCAWVAGLTRGALEARQNGEPKREGLAGACGPASEDVFTRQRVRDRCLLDGEGLRDALLVQDVDDAAGQTEVSESSHLVQFTR